MRLNYTANNIDHRGRRRIAFAFVRTRFIRRSSGICHEKFTMKTAKNKNPVKIVKLLRRENSTFFCWNWFMTGCLGSFAYREM